MINFLDIEEKYIPQSKRVPHTSVLGTDDCREFPIGNHKFKSRYELIIIFSFEDLNSIFIRVNFPGR